MATESKTVPDFAPPRWLFSWNDNGDSMPGYARHDFERGRGEAAALFSRIGDVGPQIAQAGPLAAIFDGELYEPGELARELGEEEAPENRAKLLLGSYRAHGDAFFKKLRGTFTLVVWDAEKGELLSVRDPMGYYPCFFAEAGRQVLISTSARVLLEHPQVSRGVNRLVLLDYFFDVWARREETFYSSVKRVPPGHLLRVRDGSAKTRRYWNPLPATGNGRLLKEGDQERFEEVLGRSVNRCLGHGRAGIYLSGGLDSVSVAALASQSSRAGHCEPPCALSLVFPYPEYDESAVQRSVAQQLGLPLEIVRLEDAAGPEGLFGATRDLSREFSFPIQNIWLPAYAQLTLLAKQRGIRTILTGTGGDEWLGITPLLAADLLRRFQLGKLYRVWRSIGRTAPASRVLFGWNLVWVYGLRSLLREGAVKFLERSAPRVLGGVVRARRARGKPAWADVEPELWREFLRRAEESETDFRPLEGPYGYYFGDILRGADHPLVSWEMEENFENSRRLGVRVVHPYTDAEVVEMLCGAPPELLLLGGTSKGLVREILARRFPEVGFERQKKVVIRRALPESVLGDGTGLWKRSGSSSTLAALGLADAGKLDAYLSMALKSENHRDKFRAWQVMTTEYWLRARG